jgi:integrase
MFNWAKKAGHLSREKISEMELTDRGDEAGQRIGILSPAVYRSLLVHFRAHHPEHLAALVLAGFCGVRSDEIHGKLADRSKRQTWEDIDLARGTLRVTVAKKGTASYRPVPVCPAAVKWLLLCENRSGPVCDPIAIETIRRLVRQAEVNKKPKFPELPDNCLRHSFCTYRLAVTGNVQQVAYEAGNSPALLRKHYLELASKETAEAWFAIEPGKTGEMVSMKEAAS